MTLLYYSDEFLKHRTGMHPESSARLTHIRDHLTTTGLINRCTRPAWSAVERDALLAVHSEQHLQAVQAFAAKGGGQIETDTVVSPESYDVALLACGAAVDATRRVVAGEDTSALVIARPPGHHCLADAPMGFCLLANVAVAARYALDRLGLDRVLVVDWDVHHGNGTQDIFYSDERVGFFSIHRYPFYPGSGAADETGSGAGLGATLNVPIGFGTSRRDYLSQFEVALDRFASKLRPQLVIISAGFDAHAEDPVGNLGLESEDFVPLTQIVQTIAAQHAGGKLVSVLEGGYRPVRLAESVGLHLETLLS